MATCTVPKNRHLKLSCHACEFTARATRTAMRRYGLSEHCGRPMMPDDIELAVELLPEDLLSQHHGYLEAQDSEVRRLSRDVVKSRQAWGLEPTRHRCDACPAFIKHPGAHCKQCGYCNTQGRYIETAYGMGGNDGIPF